MLPQCSHITRKRGVYYFRRRVPYPGRGEVALSLKTRNFREAEHLAWSLNLSCEIAFTDPMTDYLKYSEILRQQRDLLRSSSLERVIRTPYGKSVLSQDYDGEPEDARSLDLSETDWFIKQFTRDYQRRDLRGPEGRIRELMTEHGIPDQDFQPFGLAFFKMYIEHLKQQRDWVENGPIDLEEILTKPQAVTPKPAPAPIPSTQADEPPTNEDGQKLSEVLPDFIDLMVSTGGWTKQTEAQNTTTYRMFMAHCGDKAVTSYNRRDCASFFDVLRGLPSLYSKKPEWARLPLAEVVRLTRDQDLERLAMRTVKRHFAALGRLFDNLRRRGDYIGENPAYGFEFPNGRARASKGRLIWEGDRLKALFSSPAWSGCLSDSRRSTAGSLVIKDEKYWLPLLGLYHGNRLEEFAQLSRSDIRCEADIWYFDINADGDKQIKNAQSARRVPIHPKLIDLGFLSYVESAATKPHDKIFPLLKPGGPDRKLGYYFTKWFTRYRQDIGVYEKKLDYHSFRHGVTTKLFSADVSKVLVDTLTGHEGEGTSERVYLKELPLQKLHEAICKVEWPELDEVAASFRALETFRTPSVVVPT